MTVEEMIKLVHKSIDDKKGTDIAVINIGKITSMADYFIIASGTSERQVKAIADHVEDELAKLGIEPKGKEGTFASRWVLLDYGDFMVHVFKDDEREYYNLERLWKDAPYVDVEEL